MMPSNYLILCRPLLLLPSIFPSIRVFSNESALHIRWSSYWSFSISPSNEYSELISFRIYQFDLLAVQGTHKSLLQYHSSVQFSRSVVSDSLWPHELQHARPPCPLESINSSVLSLLYGPTLTSIHDYWKNHSFDYMDICQQSDVSAFEYTVYVCHSFSSKEQVSFNFMAAITICSNFGVKKIKFITPFFSHLFAIKWWDWMSWS